MEKEATRYNHELIDEENIEFLMAAKQKRKSQRINNQIGGELEREGDIDEEFKLEGP